MNFIKKYKCSKCGHSFPKITTGNFIKGTMPRCPICGGNETKTDNKVEKKEEK